MGYSIGPAVVEHLEEMEKRLYEVSDRLGALYQRVGRLRTQDLGLASIMDELVDLTAVVEDISNRKKREGEGLPA